MRFLKAMILTAVLALYAGPHAGALANGQTGLLIQAAAKKKSDYKLCLALRKCRGVYSYCFAQLEKKFKPHEWSAEREKCVATYKVCIAKTFKSGELMFTRWFVPEANCDQFR